MTGRATRGGGGAFIVRSWYVSASSWRMSRTAGSYPRGSDSCTRSRDPAGKDDTKRVRDRHRLSRRFPAPEPPRGDLHGVVGPRHEPAGVRTIRPVRLKIFPERTGWPAPVLADPVPGVRTPRGRVSGAAWQTQTQS